MNTLRSRLLPWIASASLSIALPVALFLAGNTSQAQSLYQSEVPPQHRATRTDTADTAPMTVVAATNTSGGLGWYWVPIDGAKCRHNTDTGIAVRFRPDSDKIVITLQGGGACYNSASCGANVPEYGLADFQDSADTNASTLKGKLYEGIWKISSPFHDGVAPIPNVDHPNEIADTYTQIFVPYCSGDMHVGARQNVIIPLVTRIQNFQGAKNTDLYYHYVVDQLIPLIRQPKVDVILTGLSGGGFGAGLTAGRLRTMLPANATMTLFMDSAPLVDKTTSTPIPASYMSQHSTVGSAYETLFRSCIQQRLHDTWGLANSVIKDCGTSCTPDSWANPSFDKFLKQWPDVFVALSSGTYDAVLRSFQSLLQADNCGWDPTEAQYTEGLLKLRAQMQAARSGRGNYATYFISTSSEKTNHVAMANQRYFTLTQLTAATPLQPSVRMQDWLQDLIDRPDNAPLVTPMQVGP